LAAEKKTPALLQRKNTCFNAENKIYLLGCREKTHALMQRIKFTCLAAENMVRDVVNLGPTSIPVFIFLTLTL
jgi:hypothetical protein